MEQRNGMNGSKDQKYLNKRALSSRKDKRSAIKNLTTHPSARNLQGARSINLKPDLIMNKARPTSRLVPSYEQGRGENIGLKRVVSEANLPGITITGKQSAHQTMGSMLPPMKRSLSRRTLVGSSLSRMYSNPQFTKLNQAPYFRPKTTAFGFTQDNQPKKDPSKKAPWTSEEVNSITGIKTMTSLAPGNAKLKKDKNESSPAKRSLSRREKRKKSSQKAHRQTFQGVSMVEKRPNTSYLLQSAADRIPWPNKPGGRRQINPLTPVKAFTFKGDRESQFLHSEKDFKMTIESYPYDLDMHYPGQHSRIDEVEEFDRDEADLHELSSVHSGKSPKKKTPVSMAKNATISDVIKLLENEPKETGQYFYLTQPEEAGPYDLVPLLQLEDHSKLQNYKKFYTLSSKGITTYMHDEPVEFITLNDWKDDKENYNKIRRKTFFQKFDRWKILRLWRRKICVKKRDSVTSILEDKLFILHGHFSKVILQLKDSCVKMEKLNFIELTDSHEAITREEFSNRQDKRRNYVEESVQNISRQNRQEFRDGIQKILTDLKVAINKGNEDDESVKKKEDEQKRVDLKTSETDRVYEDLGFKPNLKYGSKSSLRKECSRFLRCAYLLDFITMDALTNIYLNSVKSLFYKLEALSHVEIRYEFDTNKSQFGESKKIYSHGPEPMFKLEGKFQDDEIPESEYVEVKIRKFVPPPMGTSTAADFDPIVHLEIEDEQEVEEEEIDILDESDEESKYVTRKICKTLHKEWVRLDPNKGSFIDLLEESINQGYASLKNIERWSRHGELLKYVKVLESWDDKVCESWDPPDDNYLD